MSISKVSLLLDSIFAVLEDMQNEGSYTTVDAEAILHPMRFKKFVFLMYMLCKVLDSSEIFN